MAYTGTGTEQDPYLVNNLTDFLTCIAIRGAYVKVIADIDAADDENYDTELDSPIRFYCMRCYADEKKIIRGIVVRANYFMYTDVNGTTVENLSFLDCEHKKTADYYSVQIQQNRCPFISCDFSMRVLEYGNHSHFANCTATTTYYQFENCAFDIEFIHTDINSSLKYLMEKCKTHKCNIVFRNACVKNYQIVSNMNYTALLLYNVNLSESVLRPFYSAANSYIAAAGFVNSDGSTGLDVKYTGGADGIKNVLVYGTADSETDDAGTVTVVSPMRKVTAAQLRSNEYLTEIGFLP